MRSLLYMISSMEMAISRPMMGTSVNGWWDADVCIGSPKTPSQGLIRL